MVDHRCAQQGPSCAARACLSHHMHTAHTQLHALQCALCASGAMPPHICGAALHRVGAVNFDRQVCCCPYLRHPLPPLLADVVTQLQKHVLTL